ncbi:MAG: beta-ketoacyl-ACP synthase III [Desulfurivibrionaceae bacterium]
MTGIVVIGTGSAVPERVLTNADLEKLVDTSNEWIVARTGIRTRHIAGKGENTSDLGTAAARKALEMAGLEATDVDIIIMGTITPESGMPSTACLVQKKLGANASFAFDINAACSGFLYGLDMAEKYILTDPALKILVIGSETLSDRTHWEDRSTCVLFGDGAGAVVVTGSQDGRGGMTSRLFSDGSLYKLLHMTPSRGMNPDLSGEAEEAPYIKMEGREVFRYAVRALQEAAYSVLEAAGVELGDVDLIIPHQANIRILNNLTERLGLDREKLYINVDKYGNTSAASIPIALDEAYLNGYIHENSLILLCAFGGGFTWGASLLRW